MSNNDIQLSISEAIRLLELTGAMGSVVIYAQNEKLEYTDVINPPPPLTKERLIGNTDFEIFPEHATERTRIKQKVLDEGDVVRQVTTVLIDGEARQFDATFLPIKQGGKICGLLCIAAEVTVLVQAQKDLETAQQMILSKLSDRPNRLLA